MLNNQGRIALSGGAIILALGILVYVGTLSSSYRYCVRDREETYSKGRQPDFFEQSGSFIVCEGVALDSNGILITAIATLVIAFFTGTLWRSTANSGALTKRTVDLAEKQYLMEAAQADLATKQHALARLQHITANKPRLRIRSIVIKPRREGGPVIESGHLITGHLVVTNSGGTDAKILESGYRFFWSNAGLPMQPPLDGPETQPLFEPSSERITLAAYGSCAIQIKSHAAMGVETDTIGTGTAIEVTLYLMGFIHYADIDGAERFMGFCRAYQAPRQPYRTSTTPEGRFLAVDNGDYEYED